MYRMRRPLMALLLALLLTLLLPAALAAPDEGITATILFTHDLHSHLLPAPEEGGGEYGGFARLMTAMETERAAARAAERPYLTLDGGDFSMGTLFQSIYTSDASELRALGALGVDVTTLGNHEFEYRGTGLAKMLNAAVKSGDRLPALVDANYLPPVKGEAGYSGEAEQVRQAMDHYGVADYVMIEKEGVRFAVFGVLGQDAHDCAPMSGMRLEPMVDAARRVVEEIQKKEDYDFILCVSHGGTNPDPKKSEDELLAQNVEGIDFIVSGHTHSTLAEPKLVGNTIIGSGGEYAHNLGSITIRKDADGKNTVEDYRLIPIDGTLAEEPTMAARVAEFKGLVERNYLAKFGLQYDQVLAYSPFDFTPLSRFGMEQEEDGLGNLITDAYRYAVEQAEGAAGAPITATFVNSGVIRGTFPAGNITVSDAFNVSSLGSGADGSPGYPLISVWLTGREMRDVMEVDPSVGPIFGGAQLYSSGISYKFNMNRPILNRSYDPRLLLPNGATAALDDDVLYRVVTNLYSSQMLGLVQDKSFGILKVTPKDASGAPITNYEEHIIHRPDGSELKEWYALATYLASFPEEDGVPQVPDQYDGPEGRKVRVESSSPIELLRQPRWTTLLVIGLAVLVLAVILTVIVRIATRKSRGTRRSRRRRNYRG